MECGSRDRKQIECDRRWIGNGKQKRDNLCVNFINILRADFSLKSLMESFSLVLVFVLVFFGKSILAKKLNIVEIGKRCRFHQHFKIGKCFELLFSSYRCQFHQRFMCAFFIWIFRQSQNVTRKSWQNKVRTKNLYIKCWWNWHLDVKMLLKPTKGEL